MIVVGPDQETSIMVDQVKFVPCDGSDYVTCLMAGIAEANGDVLLFLQPNHHLPPDSLRAIRRNFELLPQTVGGNFHLKFKPASPLASLLKPLLKWWRYRGYYFFESGIFIRKEVYQTIGGLRAGVSHADLDLVRRMEKYGPTLYLPNSITIPPPTLAQTFKWLAGPIIAR